MDTRIPNRVDWERISSYLSGEMSEKERLDFEKLIGSNPEYAQMVAMAQSDLNTVERMHKQSPKVDVDHAWNNLKQRFEQDGLLEKKSPLRMLRPTNWHPLLRVAAMILIVAGLGWSSYLFVGKSDTGYQQIQTAYSEGGKSITLSDGSRIYLNGNTQLDYPEKFGTKERRVQLKGEAFFEIAKNPDKPFIITAGNAEVRVLGTTFNVNTLGRKVEVFVKSGRVKLMAKKDPKQNLILEKGDFGILQKNAIEKSQQTDANYLAWKTKHFEFQKANLNEVAQAIERAYQVNIEFEEAGMKELPLNATFDSEPLETILESLCITFSMTYERDGQTIRFYHKLQ